jgi:hypothetical protein
MVGKMGGFGLFGVVFKGRLIKKLYKVEIQGQIGQLTSLASSLLHCQISLS